MFCTSISKLQYSYDLNVLTPSLPDRVVDAQKV